MNRRGILKSLFAGASAAAVADARMAGNGETPLLMNEFVGGAFPSEGCPPPFVFSTMENLAKSKRQFFDGIKWGHRARDQWHPPYNPCRSLAERKDWYEKRYGKRSGNGFARVLYRSENGPLYWQPATMAEVLRETVDLMQGAVNARVRE